MKRTLALALFGVLTVASLIAHGGGLDANGGHNDRKNGGYHFHRGPLAGESYSNKAEALKALQRRQGNGSTSNENRQRNTAKAESEQGQTVYVTRTGSKYHRAGCQYLRSSSRSLDLNEALSAGYSGCSRCRPPIR